MYSLRKVNAITGATVAKATAWQLTASDVAINTETITISGVVFTTVDNIGSTAGNVLIGANKEATLANLATLINAPTATTSTGVALSANDAYIVKTVLGLTATVSGAVLTITSSKGFNSITVSETETNLAWTNYTYSDPIAMGALSGKASLQFIASGISSGNGVFTVEVSNDGSNWIAYSRLTTNATNTNGQTDTRVASITVNSNTSAVVTFPVGDVFSFFRVKVVPTTDGSYSAVAVVL